MTTRWRRRATALMLAPLHGLERARGRRRTLLILGYGAVAAVLGVFGYRASRLSGLPDIGPPVDAAAVRAIDVPDDRNAWVVWRAAIARLSHDEPVERRIFNGPWSWPDAYDTAALDYLARNAEALDLWCRGADRPDAVLVPPARLTADLALPEIAEHRDLSRMALVAASGRMDAGDVAGAWGYYRAILRASRLLGRNGFVLLRLVGTAELAASSASIAAWAADPRVDAPLLRRALADAREADALTAPASESLRIEYVADDRSLEDPEALLARFWKGTHEGGTTDPLDWRDQVEPLRRARIFLDHEPEATRRLRRLTYANWLAHADDLPATRPALLTVPGETWGVYDIPAHRAPGGVSGRELARRLGGSRLALWMIANSGPHRPFLRDRAARAGVILTLASALFQREHGRPPRSPEELVGPYLDRLPEGYAPAPNP